MALGAIRRLARRVRVDVREARHNRQIADLVAVGAGRRGRNRDMARRQGQRAEVLSGRPVAGDAVTGRRMLCILHHERTADGAGSGLETRVLRGRAAGQCGWRQRVLGHRHPSIAAFMTRLAAARHAPVDLIRGRRRR